MLISSPLLSHYPASEAIHTISFLPPPRFHPLYSLALLFYPLPLIPSLTSGLFCNRKFLRRNLNRHRAHPEQRKRLVELQWLGHNPLRLLVSCRARPLFRTISLVFGAMTNSFSTLSDSQCSFLLLHDILDGELSTSLSLKQFK